MVQIRELGQSNIVDKAGVTVDDRAQIGSPGASLVKSRVDPKLNMISTSFFNISSSTNYLITSSGIKRVTS